MESKISILQCVSDLNFSSGGPSKTVTSLSSNLSKINLEVDICTQIHKDKKLLKIQSLTDNISLINIEQKKRFSFNPLKNQVLLEKLLSENRRKKISLLHDNGIWLPFNNTIATFSRISGIPLVISPHGMLEPWSLKFNFLKKKLAWNIYQKRALKAASVLHATSIMEAQNLDRLKLGLPIAVIPNGIEKPTNKELLEKYDLSNLGIKINNEKIFLYLGRIHPKKGLLNMLKAWNDSFKNNISCKLIIAGFPELNYLNELKDYVKKNKLTKNVIFLGPVEGEDLIALYRNAYVFILPTFSENFGMVVAEALSYGVPVITTTGTPWKTLEEFKCGWIVEPKIDDLKKVMYDAFLLDKKEYELMSQNAINLSKAFDWEKIAQKFLNLYLWVLGENNSKPSNIIN